MKRETRHWQKTPANHISDKGHVPENIKKHLNVKNKKTNQKKKTQ